MVMETFRCGDVFAHLQIMHHQTLFHTQPYTGRCLKSVQFNKLHIFQLLKHRLQFKRLGQVA